VEVLRVASSEVSLRVSKTPRILCSVLPTAASGAAPVLGVHQQRHRLAGEERPRGHRQQGISPGSTSLARASCMLAEVGLGGPSRCRSRRLLCLRLVFQLSFGVALSVSFMSRLGLLRAALPRGVA
jgi:hypothetical protein